MQNPSMFDLGLFTGAEQHENFANWNQLLLSKKMLPADAPYTFPKGADKVMPKHYTYEGCLLYTSPSPRDRTRSRMPSSA